MTSATSSLTLSLHSMFLSRQLSYQQAFPNTKSVQWSVIFLNIQVMTLALTHLEPLLFSVIYFEKVGCCYSIYQLTSPVAFHEFHINHTIR